MAMRMQRRMAQQFRLYQFNILVYITRRLHTVATHSLCYLSMLRFGFGSTARGRPVREAGLILTVSQDHEHLSLQYGRFSDALDVK